MVNSNYGGYVCAKFFQKTLCTNGPVNKATSLRNSNGTFEGDDKRGKKYQALKQVNILYI